MCVRAVIVENHVHDLADWDLGLDGIQELDELLMPVTLHAASDHLAVEHVERGEQRGGAVPLVIMGHRPQASGFVGNAGLGRSGGRLLVLLMTLGTTRWRAGTFLRPDLAPELGIAS